MIYTDETSIHMEAHKRSCCRKEGQAPKPKPKYPLKVHVWAGISHSGATGVCIFEGIMIDIFIIIDILDKTLKPFIKRTLLQATQTNNSIQYGVRRQFNRCKGLTGGKRNPLVAHPSRITGHEPNREPAA